MPTFAASHQAFSLSSHPVILKRISWRAEPASLLAASSSEYSPGAKRASGDRTELSVDRDSVRHRRQLRAASRRAVDQLRRHLHGVPGRIVGRHAHQQTLGAAELATRQRRGVGVGADRRGTPRADAARNSCGWKITGGTAANSGTSMSCAPMSSRAAVGAKNRQIELQPARRGLEHRAVRTHGPSTSCRDAPARPRPRTAPCPPSVLTFSRRQLGARTASAFASASRPSAST